MKKVINLSLFILIFLFSCNDVSDFLFETEQTVEVRSVDNGYIFTGGESLPLSIFFDRNIIPGSFTVTIIDDEGINWGETSVEIPLSEDEYNTSLLIPGELPQGKYMFHIRVFEEELEISFKEIIVFKTDENYVVEQLISMPHETKANKDVLINADLSYPEDSDPFLRWSIDGSVLDEGLLSEGLDTLHWLSGTKSGIYMIDLEVFPEYCDTSMKSSVFASTEIVVSDEPLIEPDSLLPEDEYSLLFHFSGDYLPLNESDYEIVESGRIEVGSFNNKLVYHFSENNGLNVAGSILPFSSGKITSFSINGRFSPADGLAGGNIISFTNEEQDIFAISLSDTNHLIFQTGDFYSTSLFSVYEMTDFSIQMIPFEQSVEIRWFYNGNNGGSDVLNTEFPLIDEIQTALVGGNDVIQSAHIIIDELGVYIGDETNSKVDSSQYKRVKEYTLRESLIAADGFDDIDGDRVVIPGENLILQTFPLSVRDTEIVLSLPESTDGALWNLNIKNSEGISLAVLPETAAVDEIDVGTGLISTKMRISLVFDEENEIFELNTGTDLHNVLNSVYPGDMLSLFLETNVENKNNVLLDFYIIFTNIDSVIPELIVTADEVENLL